ncbi:MAG: hypothetical protein NC041_07340 [Bacteroides sp.]|nr:hypothetical protein [Prevotella sp.]MCM1407112.1 galactokinase [Treponema brennaborense]MCM1470264.1 hypothetical protein [Bacteroides sp.]
MEQVVAAHSGEYEDSPEVIVSAPGRFHLIGDHSWFFRDKTMSMAVDLPVSVAVSRRSDTSLRFYFPQLRERKRSSTVSVKFRREDRWANSIKAMIFGCQSFGFDFPGMNFTVYSDIVPSAGFGITTAIKAASAIALQKMCGSSRADNIVRQVIDCGNKRFLSAESYAADINTVLYAREKHCIITDHKTGTYSFVPFPFDDAAIVLTDARVPRISVWNEESLRTEQNRQLLAGLKQEKNGSWEYEQLESEINDALESVSEETRRRLLCVMKEHQCLLEAADALHAADFMRFARAVNKSHEMLRDLYLLSCPEIDWLVKRVLEMDNAPLRNPTACARITGKGFGRCTYTILKKEKVGEYMSRLAEYERIFGFHPASYIVTPVSGACSGRQIAAEELL